MVPEAKPHGTLTSELALPLMNTHPRPNRGAGACGHTCGGDDSLTADLVPQPASLLLLLLRCVACVVFCVSAVFS